MLADQFITAGQFAAIMGAVVTVIWATVRFSISQVLRAQKAELQLYTKTEINRHVVDLHLKGARHGGA